MKIREERKDKKKIKNIHGLTDGLRPQEQGKSLSLYLKLGLHKRVFILTLK